MVEEVGTGPESGNISEEISEVSEADLAAVHQSQAKAKQIRVQIQEMQAKNANYAWMLTIILTHINDEEMLMQVSWQLKSLSVPAVFAQLAPYLAEQTSLDAYYEQYPAVAAIIKVYDHSLTGLVGYLQGVRNIYLEITNEPMTQYVKYVASYAEMMGLVDRSGRDTEKRNEFLQSLLWQL